MKMKIHLSSLEMRTAIALSINGASSCADLKRLTGSTEGRKTISNLIRKGLDIRNYWCDGVNSYGERVRFKEV